MVEPVPEPALPDFTITSYISTLVHFYRGESAQLK